MEEERIGGLEEKSTNLKAEKILKKTEQSSRSLKY